MGVVCAAPAAVMRKRARDFFHLYYYIMLGKDREKAPPDGGGLTDRAEVPAGRGEGGGDQ